MRQRPSASSAIRDSSGVRYLPFHSQEPSGPVNGSSAARPGLGSIVAWVRVSAPGSGSPHSWPAPLLLASSRSGALSRSGVSSQLGASSQPVFQFASPSWLVGLTGPSVVPRSASAHVGVLSQPDVSRGPSAGPPSPSPAGPSPSGTSAAFPGSAAVPYGSSAVTSRSRVSSRSAVPSVLAAWLRPFAPLLLLLADPVVVVLADAGLAVLAGAGAAVLAGAGAAGLAGAGAAVLAGAGAAVLADAGLTVLVSGALVLLADAVRVSATLSSATLSSADACAVPALPPLLLCSVPCSGSSRFFSLATAGLGVMSSL